MTRDLKIYKTEKVWNKNKKEMVEVNYYKCELCGFTSEGHNIKIMKCSKKQVCFNCDMLSTNHKNITETKWLNHDKSEIALYKDYVCHNCSYVFFDLTPKKIRTFSDKEVIKILEKEIG